MALACSHPGPCQPGCHNWSDTVQCGRCLMPVPKPKELHSTPEACITALGMALSRLKQRDMRF